MQTAYKELVVAFDDSKEKRNQLQEIHEYRVQIDCEIRCLRTEMIRLDEGVDDEDNENTCC
jgi:hypothetical protein